MRGLRVLIDPRITAQDLDEKLVLSVGATVLDGVAITVSVRTNFLTVEVNSDEDSSPSILWIPMTTLLPAMGEISKRAGN